MNKRIATNINIFSLISKATNMLIYLLIILLTLTRESLEEGANTIITNRTKIFLTYKLYPLYH